MKKKLKLKILAGFLLIVALLIVAGTVSIVEFIKLSRSVNSLIEDNYKTIESTKRMLEALERKDSGVLLILLGEREEGKEIINEANTSFIQAFGVAKNNITEANEEQFIEKIDSLYLIFKIKVDIAISDKLKAGDMSWYHGEVFQSFLDVKHAVDELMVLNQSSMYNEATILKDKSHRAIMPGIVAIVGALILSLLLSFFISKYYVSPISDLAEAVKSFHPREKNLRSKIKSNDEIKELENEINNLIYRLIKQQEDPR